MKCTKKPGRALTNVRIPRLASKNGREPGAPTHCEVLFERESQKKKKHLGVSVARWCSKPKSCKPGRVLINVRIPRLASQERMRTWGTNALRGTFRERVTEKEKAFGCLCVSVARWCSKPKSCKPEARSQKLRAVFSPCAFRPTPAHGLQDPDASRRPESGGGGSGSPNPC
jgi:hypothetical protein